MDHYLDIRVLPDPEFSQSDLLNAVFAKLHRQLGQKTQGKVGVSFPRFEKRLGDVLRLHGSRHDLEVLLTDNWLQGLKDYTQSTALQAVPELVQYRTVSRVQAKSAHNKRKRSIAKGWLSEAEAWQQIPEGQQKRLTLPFVQLRSLSNGNRLRVYIEHGPLLDKPSDGVFSAYGLSRTATIPWF
ncbi:type I-F CRISPR-associated endoribonuclease Cas6/Csy4 [Zobellella aerophila]|uniref:Type I-F CRISPR-associated endoribonuclease Cas6/Csy4 n=1 Tax=Zobellella aerophila TaxID=870480 RepID=A0ABP6VF58_9GAMM